MKLKVGTIVVLEKNWSIGIIVSKEIYFQKYNNVRHVGCKFCGHYCKELSICRKNDFLQILLFDGGMYCHRPMVDWKEYSNEI